MTGESKVFSKRRAWFGEIASIVTLGIALFMSIPPVLSNDTDQHSITPALVIGGLAFCVFLWLSKRPVWTGIAMLLVYLAFVWVLNERIAYLN
jgi:hypothetical protein